MLLLCSTRFKARRWHARKEPHETVPAWSRLRRDACDVADGHASLGARRQTGGRAPLYLELRRGRCRRHFALVAGGECGQVDGLRRQLLFDQAQPRLASLGHRLGRCHRRHARGPAARRSAHDALASAEKARSAARAARRETLRHQIRRGLPHPSRPHRQRDDVPAEHAAGAEGRVRMAFAGGTALQTGASRDQARGRPRRVRRRQRRDHLHARTHAGPPEPAGQIASDRRRAALGRRGALPRELGEPPRAGEQRQQGQDRGLDAAHGRRHGQGKGAALDQSRQGSARRAEDVARLLQLSMVRCVGSACGAFLVASVIGAAQAQSGYPNRVVTLIVPYPAGGTADLLCRFAADKAGSNLAQQVVVENRSGGAGGRVGTEAVLRAPPDGYTLLCAAQLTFSVTHLLFAKASFDTRALEPVSVLATYPLILIARADLPFDRLQDLIAYARANPGKINYGHQGKGQTGHLLGELLMLRGKFRMTEIPYRGSAPAINDLLAGNIDLVPDYLLANKANIDAGKLKLLATGSRERLKDYPRVATIAETLPSVYADTWMAVAAPPGTPKEIAQKVSQAIRQGFQQRELRARILALEADPLASTPQEMRELIRQSLETWGPVIEAAKIVVE